eukprot:Sdes_comp19126_c0_seq2m9846
MSNQSNVNISIIGGGLVGSLNACYFAKRGFKVNLYESRKDIRNEKIYSGKSINLAMSKRGLEALSGVGLSDAVKKSGLPMYGRMIHHLDGSRSKQMYGIKPEEHLYSVDRRKLNEILLNEAEKNPNVRLFFSHKLAEVSSDLKTLTFSNQKDELAIKSTDFIVGCDGAYSAVRKHYMKQTRFNYSQEYIPHGYKELSIPPNAEGDFAMENDFLHIWPRNEFMMIALPNQDKSFTGTLFMPFEIFESLKTSDDLIHFFHRNFPDAIPLIGKDLLIHDFFHNPTSALISIKCSPYHLQQNIVLMGDAAHAMVPFYGQGMNAGFEDCLIFNELLNQHQNNLNQVAIEFSKQRKDDAHAICDLAMYNYIEMREKVNSKWFLFRKSIDNILHRFFPKVFIPLYTMVSFTRIPYSVVVKNHQIQSKLIDHVLMASSFTGLLGLVWMTRKILFR